MREPDFFFFRGCSPVLELWLPLSLDEQSVLCATFSQGGQIMLECVQNVQSHSRSEIAPEVDGRMVRLALTEQETMDFLPGDCELQLRVRTEAGSDTFFPLCGAVGQARKEGGL